MASNWLKTVLYTFPNHPEALGPAGSDSQDCRRVFADLENTHGKVEGQFLSFQIHQIIHIIL